jgi:hypothetical protein
MALFPTALGLYGGVLLSGELRGFIVHEMLPIDALLAFGFGCRLFDFDYWLFDFDFGFRIRISTRLMRAASICEFAPRFAFATASHRSLARRVSRVARRSGLWALVTRQLAIEPLSTAHLNTEQLLLVRAA